MVLGLGGTGPRRQSGLAQRLALSVAEPWNGTENNPTLSRQYISSFLLLASRLHPRPVDGRLKRLLLPGLGGGHRVFRKSHVYAPVGPLPLFAVTLPKLTIDW